jgi:hypothetical protein
MYLILKIEDYNKDYIIFGKKTKNNIIKNSNFYSIQYSNDLFILNNVVLKFELKDIYIEHYFNKIKINFSYENNEYIINLLRNIEKDILKLFKLQYNDKVQLKNKDFKLTEQLNKNNIKCIDFDNSIITDKNMNDNIIDLYIQKLKDSNIDNNYINKIPIYLKLSGIWENNESYGIIYKFFI